MNFLLINRAIDLVYERHDKDYVDNHLENVAHKVWHYALDNDTYVAAWLHDILEDTNTSYEELKYLFGERIAMLVWRLTDEPGHNRKTRKLKTYWKIREDSNAVLIKLCDRWENVRNSLATKSKFADMYGKEYYTFKAALWNPNDQLDSLWNELDAIHEKIKEKNAWL